MRVLRAIRVESEMIAGCRHDPLDGGQIAGFLSWCWGMRSRRFSKTLADPNRHRFFARQRKVDAFQLRTTKLMLEAFDQGHAHTGFDRCALHIRVPKKITDLLLWTFQRGDAVA